MASRASQVAFIVGRRFPSYSGKFRRALFEALRENKGHSDTSDQVVDAVRSRIDLELDDLWGNAGERTEVETALKQAFGTLPPDERERERVRRFIDDARGFEGELNDLPDDSLRSLYAEEKAQERIEGRAQAAERDQWAFFSAPDAAADFDYWRSLPHWSIDEAVALCFGKEPRVVTWDRLQPELRLRKSPFAQSFDQHRDLVKRALQVGDLEEPLRPWTFLDWAQRNGITFPPQIEPRTRSDGAPDWKQKYQQLAAERDELKRLTECQHKELQALRADFDDLNPKSKLSLLTLVLGMAICRYGYQTDMRTGVAKLIAGELEQIRLKLSDDTIRDWLARAATDLDVEWKTPIPMPGKPLFPKPKSD